VVEIIQAHVSRSQIFIVGIDELDSIGTIGDQSENVRTVAVVVAIDANSRPKPLLHRPLQNCPIGAAGILDSVVYARLFQGGFQILRRGKMGVGANQAIENFDLVEASECLQSAPAASARRKVLDAAINRYVDLRQANGCKQEQNERCAE